MGTSNRRAWWFVKVCFTMAAALISRKRGINEAFGISSPVEPVGCSPRKVSFLGLEEKNARRAKRTLMMLENGRMRSSEAHKLARGLLTRCVQPHPKRGELDESPEPSSFGNDSPALVGDLDLGRSKKRLCKMCKQRPGERVYSESEVREIVQKALNKRETEMEETYNEILQNKLEEQYQEFSRFHEDCVSRQLNQ